MKPFLLLSMCLSLGLAYAEKEMEDRGMEFEDRRIPEFIFAKEILF